MVSDCTFVLPGGSKCRGVALRGQSLCRHHMPGAKTRPPSPPKRSLYSRLIRWRDLGRSIPFLAKESIPEEILGILYAMLEDDGGISDRQAGKLLRSLIRSNGDVPVLPHPETAGMLNIRIPTAGLPPGFGTQPSLRQTQPRMPHAQP
ncbi:hypothetical protein [Paracidobacterium acidisoli]|uniref:Uncharacterized protein n=1 Tax=Paracidobacterium acidisoli TaxID=2303751 RepID=A0A372INP6_9BACT|nr:hypothetical protein [Paracidobacterium acidisoli]MBT9331859.1 hypothetical protein [Paracidobacterium acidisoli]